MPHSRCARAAAAIAVLVPSVAWANAGIGFFSPASFLLVLGLIPVVLVEAPFVAWRLALPARRALWVSFCANAWSALLGLVAGLAIDILIGVGTGSMGSAGPEGFLLALVLLFGVTLWAERRVVRHMQPAAPEREVGRATLYANLLTYALLAAFTLAYIPPDSTGSRFRLVEVFDAARAAREEAEARFHAQGSFHASRVEAPTKYTRSITTDESGRVTAVIAFPPRRELDGKSVVYEPVIRDGRIVEWHCYTPDAPVKYMPASCRNTGPPR